MGKIFSTYEREDRCIKCLALTPEGKSLLGIPRHRWEDRIKSDLQELEWGGHWLDWSKEVYKHKVRTYAVVKVVRVVSDLTMYTHKHVSVSGTASDSLEWTSLLQVTLFVGTVKMTCAKQLLTAHCLRTNNCNIRSSKLHPHSAHSLCVLSACPNRQRLFSYRA